VTGLVFSLSLILPALVFGLIYSFRTFGQTGDAQPLATPSPSASPSPSPSPTPITGLHQWGAVTLFHGLPSDRVRAIAQTNDGAMWFGTEAGLAKFDGRRTQTINDPALPAGRVLALQTDSDGGLWIGTEAGASRYTSNGFELVKETSGQTVSCIISPEPRRVIISTEQGQIFESRVLIVNTTAVASGIAESQERSTGTREVIDTKSLLRQPLESVDHDHPGPLVITSLSWANNRLFAGTLSRGVVEILDGGAKDPQMRPIAYFVNALALDSSGKLWVGARSKKEEPGALSGELPSELNRSDAATGPVMALQSIGNEMWIGTDGRGVFRVSKEKTQRFTFDGTAGGLRSDHVYAIFQDREGVIWFGTDRGVCRFDPHAPRVESVGDNGDSNFVRSLFQTSAGKTLAGTNRGLFVYDEATSLWKPVVELGRNIIYAIAEDKQQRLLIASASGFYVASKANQNLETITFTRLESSSGTADAAGSVRAITEFRGSTFFAIYGRGIERLDNGRSSLTWTNATGSNREVISILADDDSRLLIGTAKDGVFSSDGKTIQAEPSFDPLKGPAIRSMTRTADGSLWFGTSGGVYLCQPQKTCLPILPNVDARFLLSNQSSQANEIWCGTRGNGLLRILLDPLMGAVVSELDSEQGLPSQNVFAVLPQRDAQGNDLVLIGTNRGIARYEPGKIPPTLFATRVVSKRVHSPTELQAGLDLEYPQNSLLLDVTAISSRTFPEQFQYAFILADSAGRIVRQKLSRESQFTMEGLKPGTYTVAARAFTKDLTVSQPLKFSFTVAKAPFPWTSTALAILLALALLALLWAILERRRIVATSAALVDANRDLADARVNLANEAERERRRIARDLHDQTLADLRHLALLTDQMKPNGDQTQSSTLRQEIESISQEVRRICEDLSPSVLQNVGFAAALEFALSHTAQDAPAEKRFDYEFHCDDGIEERTQLSPSVQMQIYRIVQEAVNNIWRHAAASHVKMFVATNDTNDFSLTLEDNGCSFDLENRKPDGRGLANMRARAGLIDAEIAWRKGEDGGTVFTLVRKAKSTESVT
jgi:signal transduction histidine kinase/ligand-binding sensor domain-containing protein